MPHKIAFNSAQSSLYSLISITKQSDAMPTFHYLYDIVTQLWPQTTAPVLPHQN